MCHRKVAFAIAWRHAALIAPEKMNGFQCRVSIPGDICEAGEKAPGNSPAGQSDAIRSSRGKAHRDFLDPFSRSRSCEIFVICKEIQFEFAHTIVAADVRRRTFANRPRIRLLTSAVAANRPPIPI